MLHQVEASRGDSPALWPGKQSASGAPSDGSSPSLYTGPVCCCSYGGIRRSGWNPITAVTLRLLGDV